jgi:hypothetical protein
VADGLDKDRGTKSDILGCLSVFRRSSIAAIEGGKLTVLDRLVLVLPTTPLVID